MNSIFSQVSKIISPIYAVGGCVRAFVMNIIPEDYDFTCPYTPDEIESAIKASGRKSYTAGKRYGTLGLKIEGHKIEITTFRTETYINGSRKPQVQFVNNLKEDLSRRDFTMNSLAIDVNNPEIIIDCFEGFNDIENRLIRAVGNPIKRFREDPLRLLRAIRFEAQLDFKIETYTYDAIIEKSYKILQISKERWMQELDKILLSDRPIVGLNSLMKTKLLSYIIPELTLQYNFNQENPHHTLPLWEHTLGVVNATPKEINLRWAALLHDIAKPFLKTYNYKKGYYNYIKHDYLGAEIVDKTARYLKWSNERRELIVELVRTHMQDNSPLRQYDIGGKIGF